MDDGARALVHEGAAEQVLRQAARGTGMASMRDDGERWVLDGTTTREEILRVTRDT